MKSGGTRDGDADGVNEAATGKGTGMPPDTSSSSLLQERGGMITALVSHTNEARPGSGTE